VPGPLVATHTIPGSSAVYGIASLGEFVYVVRNYAKRIDVYRVATMTLQRRLPLPQLSYSASGMAACSKNNCLYVGDWSDNSVIRVNLANSNKVKKWEVANKPEGLSVNQGHNVLVACLADSVLEEYTTDGCLVRQIVLKAGVSLPWHAVQLSTGDYVLTQYKPSGVVSIVGQDGRPLRSYRGSLKYPRCIAVTQRGDLLIADTGNSRILNVDSMLTGAEELRQLGDLHEPCVLHLDETRDRLYVGEIRAKCRLIVFSNISRIYTS